MPNIVLTQPLGVNEQQKKILELLGEVRYYDTIAGSTEEWLERVRGADVIYSNIPGLDEGWKSLKNVYLTIPFVGYSFMDVDVLKTNKVVCSNSPGCNQIAVTEWIVAMLLNYARRFPSFIHTREISEPKPVVTTSIYGKSVCIMGKGNIGSRAGKALKALGMKVDYYTRGDDLDEKIGDVDFIVDCLSYNSSTEKFYNDEFFSKTKDGVVFMTISRSETQDIDAILRQLDSGKIKHNITDNAAAIIFDEHDNDYLRLIDHPKVTITPHVAAYSDVTIATASQMCVENIQAYLAGRPINLVYC